MVGSGWGVLFQLFTFNICFSQIFLGSRNVILLAQEMNWSENSCTRHPHKGEEIYFDTFFYLIRVPYYVVKLCIRDCYSTHLDTHFHVPYSPCVIEGHHYQELSAVRKIREPLEIGNPLWRTLHNHVFYGCPLIQIGAM